MKLVDTLRHDDPLNIVSVNDTLAEAVMNKSTIGNELRELAGELRTLTQTSLACNIAMPIVTNACNHILAIALNADNNELHGSIARARMQSKITIGD